MATDIRAAGLLSLSPVILGFFGTGMMVERLKHEVTSHSSSDLLKICVKMGASWSAEGFRQAGVTPSGPGAFLLLVFLKTWRTGEGGGGCRRCEWCFFQTCNRTHSDRVPVFDSPGDGVL